MREYLKIIDSNVNLLGCTWKRVREVHKYSQRTLTALSFSDFIQHYYRLEGNRYIQIKTIGDEQ